MNSVEVHLFVAVKVENERCASNCGGCVSNSGGCVRGASLSLSVTLFDHHQLEIEVSVFAFVSYSSFRVLVVLIWGKIFWVFPFSCGSVIVVSGFHSDGFRALYLVVAQMGFSVVFHHMGKFERFRGRMLRYEGGEEHVVRGLDPDMWSYFEALGILKKDFKYDGELYMWWKPKKGRMDRDLRPLCEDKHALELAKYAENINEEVEIYVDHLVSSA